MIRAAIVGIGRWGRTLVGSVQGKSGAIRFTSGHNRTRAHAEAFCAEHGIKLADSLDAILADPAIDAVVFATPHSEHGAQVEQAAAAGKHVFMEKPFTLDRKSAGRALDAVAREGVVLGVAYPRRFHPGMRELKARIDDGRLGTIAHCHAEQNAPAGPARPRRESSRIAGPTGSSPSLRRPPRRSAARRPTRSPPTRSCTASPRSRRSSARRQPANRLRSPTKFARDCFVALLLAMTT